MKYSSVLIISIHHWDRVFKFAIHVFAGRPNAACHRSIEAYSNYYNE